MVWNCVGFFQGFFRLEGYYGLVVAAFEGRVWLAYTFTWIGVALEAIDLAITIFRNEYFREGPISLKNILNPSDATVRNLIFHGFAAGINMGVLIGWIAYFAHGSDLFHGEITLGTMAVSPTEYTAYFLINVLFVISITIFTLFLISTNLITIKRFQKALNPRQLLPVPEPTKPEPAPKVTIIDEMRVPVVGVIPSEPPYVPVEERKAQKLEELRIRRENMFEEEKQKLSRELEEKKQELLSVKRKEQETKMRRSKHYKKIRQEIEFKKDIKAQSQKSEEKPPAKKRDEFDFT